MIKGLRRLGRLLGPAVQVGIELKQWSMPRGCRELVQLCRDWDVETGGHDLLGVQVKLDGYRSFFASGGTYTREGAPLTCASHCIPGLKRLEQAFGQAMFFDGEYVEESGFDATVSAARSGVGSGVFWIFDAVPLDQWQANCCLIPFHERQRLLEQAFSRAHVPTFVGMVETFNIAPADVQAHAEAMWALEYEGIVLKRLGSTYRRERTDDWRRLKRVITFDAVVTDVLSKNGKFSGLLCRREGGSTLRISAGFTDWQKAEIMRLQHQMAGYFVECAANTKAGSSEPRHAKFVRFREDKSPSRAIAGQEKF